MSDTPTTPDAPDTSTSPETDTPDTPNPSPSQSPEKPVDEWVTSDEPMTGPQRSYLETLCREAGTEFDDSLTKADASKMIEELQAKTGRGQGGSQ